MGIFSKQGPYQEFKPLFVKEFDAKDTIKTLNAKYSELDALANINKTPALTYEQQEADKIHATHQEALNKSVDTGELSPWKAITMTKGLAHSYANDTDRLKFERSLAAKETSDKIAGDNPNKYGASQLSQDQHAYAGGSPKQVYNGYTASKDIDVLEKASKVRNLFNSNSVSGHGIKTTSIDGVVKIVGEDHEYLTADEVSFVANNLFKDPEIINNYKDQSYAEVGDKIRQQISAENPNISEMELRAMTYERMMTPLKRTRNVPYYKKNEKTGKNEIAYKKQTYYNSELQESIDSKVENLTRGFVGAVAFDKYKSTLSLNDLRRGSGNGDENDKEEPLALGSTMDNFLDTRSLGLTNLNDELKGADSSLKTAGQNTMIFAMNALKQAYSAVKVVGGTPYDPNNEEYRTNADNVRQAVKNIKAEALKRKIGIDIPEINADLSNIDDVNAKAELAVKLLTSATKQQLNVPVIPVVNQSLVKVVSNLDLTSSEIVYIQDGQRSKAKISDYVVDDGSDLIPQKYTTSSDKTKYISENLKVNNIQADGDNVYLRGSIGDREVLLKPPFLNTTTAFQPLINFTKLTSSDLSEVPLPNKSLVLRKEGHTKILKHSAIDERTGEVTYTYSLNGKGGTPPLNQTDFYNTYLQKEIDLGIKGTQLKKLFQNLDIQTKDYVSE